MAIGQTSAETESGPTSGPRSRMRRVLSAIGLDRAIGYTILGRGWSVIAGPISLLCIVRFLSKEEQGFYYTFADILGLQIFFELGLTSVLLRFASHENAKLHWTVEGTLAGDATSKSRLASLLRMALLWYGIAAFLVTVIVLPTGLAFFTYHQSQGQPILWQAPWLLVVFVAASMLFVSPILAVLEGCGLMAEVARLQLWQSILGSLLLWSALFRGWGLLAAPVANAAGLTFAVWWLWRRQGVFLRDLLAAQRPEATVRWWGEVWPFQWRIAVSWFAGYFIFRLFNPILFAYRGAAAAGRMGMSLSIMNTLSAMAMAWLYTKTPTFGRLIVERDYVTLDRTFFTSLWQSLMCIIAGCTLFWIAAFVLHSTHHRLSERLLDPLPLAFLAITTIINQVVFAEAAYLRSHKQEPFMALSLINGGCMCLSTYFLGRWFGATGMLAGYLIISMTVGLGMGTWIFVTKRREWHGENARS